MSGQKQRATPSDVCPFLPSRVMALLLFEFPIPEWLLGPDKPAFCPGPGKGPIAQPFPLRVKVEKEPGRLGRPPLLCFDRLRAFPVLSLS